MLDAFYLHLTSEHALPATELEEAKTYIKDIRNTGFADDINFLCELATNWVRLNPIPIVLTKSNYNR
ncbi:hypothetical protein D3C87_2077060 [compost metagenome]